MLSLLQSYDEKMHFFLLKPSMTLAYKIIFAAPRIKWKNK